MTNKFPKYDLNGKLLYSWGTYGSFPGQFWGVHQFSVDSDGHRDLRRAHAEVPAQTRRRSGPVDRAAGEQHRKEIGRVKTSFANYAGFTLFRWARGTPRSSG